MTEQTVSARTTIDAPPDVVFAIVSDPHQRIYDNHVSLASMGIEVRGRSRKLTINYRTTQEILAWSVRFYQRSAAEILAKEAAEAVGRAAV